MFYRCSVPGCDSLRYDVKLHVFPSNNAIRLSKWLNSINCDVLRNLSATELGKRYVCQKHFESRFVTAKSRLLGTAYPSLFSNEEMSTGIPAQQHEDIGIRPTDHTYSRKRHYDHTYAASSPRDLVISQPPTCLSDVTINEASISRIAVADLPPLPSTSSMEVPIISSPASDMVSHIPLTQLKSLSTPKRKRLVNKVAKLTPKCQKLFTEYKKSRRQLNFNIRAKKALQFSKDQSFVKLTENMSAYAKRLFWMQINLSKRNKKARRFSLEEKIISLAILKQSPKCYKFLQKIFILPSQTTLKKLVSGLKMETGINPQIFDLIKQEVTTWNSEKRYCSIIFDEMALEPALTYDINMDKIDGFVELTERSGQFADHVLVFMVKGIIHKWQQPIGFYFCSGATSGPELQQILKKVVEAVGDAGLKPLAIISDQGTAFQSALKNLQESTRREQILENQNTDGVISLSGHTLSVIYDPPHLIKGLRNNFLTKDILFEGKLAKWEDLIDVYEADCRHAESRILHKLNDEHIMPNKIKKMKVKNCTQVFSKTMTAALSYTSEFSHYTNGKPVSKTLRNTAKVVGFFDDLFDSVNGASLDWRKNKGKVLRKAVTKNSPHVQFWTEAIKKLKSIRFVDKITKKQTTVPSLKNWVTTLESYLRLWQYLQNKNIKILRPRYMNSDSIENFFGQVRAYNFRNINPDCHNFISTFKSLIITGFIKFHNDSFNCEDDRFNQLLKINNLFNNSTALQSNNQNSSNENENDNENIEVINIDNIATNTLEEARRERLNVHSRAYTAGWVVRKVITKIQCQACKQKLTTATGTNIHKWISEREYKKNIPQKLTYPSEQAVRYFGVIHKDANKYLEENAFKMNISKNIKENCFSNYNLNDLACESHQEETVQLFLGITLKLVIHNWCNIINKILRGVDIIRLQRRNDLPPMQRQALLKYNKKLKKNK